MPLGLVQSLEEVRKEKFVPFTYGPLYVHGGVPFDIVRAFTDETGVEVLMSYYDFPDAPLINLPAPYAHRLFAMDDSSYSKFCDWLSTVEIANVPELKFAVPLRVAAPILDPFVKMIGAVAPVPEIVDVWTISRMDNRIIPATHVETLPYPIFQEGEAEDLEREAFLARLPRPTTAPEKITLELHPADPQVIVRGKSLFAKFD